jgi:nitroimidazol reductase NimA-like FMN-containing flavoprotein (pyridoxamine 5'-phosphate oxidase superfamily)
MLLFYHHFRKGLPHQMDINSYMNKQIPIKKYIEDALRASRLAVLATESDGQPHASLIAITPVGGIRQLIFVTYRDTRKFENLAQNGKVAVLIQGEDIYSQGRYKSFALTAFGNAHESKVSEFEEALHTHLERHPDLENFIRKNNFALIHIMVDTYQVVRDIDNVSWWSVTDLETSSSMVAF